METTNQDSRNRQHIVQAFALVILVVFTVAASIPLQKMLDQRMEDLKREVIALLENATGRSITFSKFSPSILRYLDIRDMKILASDESSEALVSINRARVYFNLLAFLRGKRQDAIRKISIEDTTIVVNLDEDSDVLALFEKLAGIQNRESEGQPIDTPATVQNELDLVIGGKNLNIRLLTKGRIFETKRLFFDLSTGVESYELKLSADISGTLREEDPVRNVSVSVSLDTLLSPGLDLMNGEIEVSDFVSSAFAMADQTFQLRLRDREWTLRKIQDSLPVDIEFLYSMERQIFEIDLSAESFNPLSLLQPLGSYTELETFLDIQTDGSGLVRIDIPNGNVEYHADLSATVGYDFLPAELGVATSFRGTQTGVDITALNVSSGYGSLSYTGSVGFGSIQPIGTLSVSNFTYPLGRPISGEGNISYKDGRIRFESAELRIDGEKVRNIAILVEQREDGADFSANLQVNDASNVTVEGTVVLGEERSLDVATSIRSVGIRELWGLAAGTGTRVPASGLVDGAVLDADVFLQTDFEQFSYSISNLQANNPEKNLSVSITASGSEDEIRLSKIAATVGAESVGGTVTVNLEGDGLASIVARLNYREQTYNLAGEFDRLTGLFISGDYGLDAAFLTATEETLFRIDATALPLPYAGSVLLATLRLSGAFTSAEQFSVELSNTTIENLPLLPSGAISISMDGEITETAASLTRLQISDPVSTISGTVDAQYTLGAPFSVDGSGILSSDATGEYYTFAGTYTKDSLRLDAVFDKSPVERFGEFPLSGEASGNIALSGTIDSPDIVARVTMDDGRLNEGSIDLTAAITLNDRHLSIADIAMDLQSTRISNGQIRLDFADSSVSGSADFAGAIQNKPLQASLDVAGKFELALRKNDLGKIVESDFRLLASATSIVLGDPPRRDWILDVVRTGSTIAISGGIEDSVNGTIDLDGSFDIRLGAPMPVSVRAAGRVFAGEIDATLSDIRIDMAGVESLVTIPFFNITEGVGVSGINTVRISGRLNDPDIFGELAASEMIARVPVIPETIGPFSGRLSFQGKKLVIDNALMPVGKGAVLGYVDFTLDHWLPREYEIELITDPENRNGLHIQYVFGSIDVDGYANGVLSVTGDPISTKLTGEFAIRNTDIQIGEKNPGLGRADGPGLIIDLEFTTERQVIFFWPGKNLPVMKAAAATGQVLKLKSNYIDNSLSVVGDIDVLGGDIFYFRRNFNIRQGQIRFNENQDRFDPFITVRAEAKDRTDDGEDLTYAVIVENQPFSAFNPRFESDPPMASIDILTRLGQSIVHDASGNPSLSSAIALTTDIVSQFGIFRSVEQAIRNTLQLDLFSLRTQIIQNIVTENFFPTAAMPIGGKTDPLRYLDNTTLYLGKYLRNDLFVEAMFRLRSNQALLTSADAYAGLSIDSEIRLEWQTPLFLLEFSMLPDLVDPMSSITSSRIGLSWDF